MQRDEEHHLQIELPALHAQMIDYQYYSYKFPYIYLGWIFSQWVGYDQGLEQLVLEEFVVKKSLGLSAGYF